MGYFLIDFNNEQEVLHLTRMNNYYLNHYIGFLSIDLSLPRLSRK